MSVKLAVVDKESDEIDIGLPKEDRQKAAESVARVLASSYLLYLKTQAYHWNVTGAEFYNLHLLFETQYKELRKAIDMMAERLRALGVFAPGTFREFLSLSCVEEDKKIPRDWQGMVRSLLKGHESLAKDCRKQILSLQKTKDEGSIDLLIERLKLHEKTGWMLRSFLRDSAAK